MPRLFVGLEISEAARFRLSLVKGPIPGARWIDADNLHITLRFCGDIDNRQADELVGFLDEIDVAPFSVTIGELGTFGGREPRLLYAGVTAGPELEQLQRATERAARSAGLAPEAQAYKPHVTLARLRGVQSEATARLLASRARLAIEPLRVDQFVLFSSRPRVGGGPYVVEATFQLR
jgi:2'-5' RNA ligase